MILLGKIFVLFAQEITLYISGCGAKHYCQVNFLFASHKKLFSISEVVVLNDIVRKVFDFPPTSKGSCISQAVLFNDIIR